MSGSPPTNLVVLSANEIQVCQRILLSAVCQTIKIRIYVLLALNNNYESGRLSFGQVAAAFNKNKDFPTAVARQYKEVGLKGLQTIKRNTASNFGNLKMDAWTESELLAMVCALPPKPYVRWTISLCTSEFNRRMGLNFSRSTVWRALQRNKLQPHRSEYWCIPSITEEFILQMEKVLHLYSLPYDKDYPVVCMDEAALQILCDVKQRLETKVENVEKIDYEYRRLGTKNVFVFIEPKKGRYYVRATDSRTAVDWANEIKILAFILGLKKIFQSRSQSKRNQAIKARQVRESIVQLSITSIRMQRKSSSSAII